jgi:hypothetical protein
VPLKVKPGVSFRGVTPQLALGIQIVVGCYQRMNYDCIITSLSDSKHGARSLHNRPDTNDRDGIKCDAADFRINHVRREAWKRLANAISTSLGEEFDVVLENDHIHVEYDPDWRKPNATTVADAGSVGSGVRDAGGASGRDPGAERGRDVPGGVGAGERRVLADGGASADSDTDSDPGAHTNPRADA